MPEREILEVDALFVGAGPAGLCGAIRLARLAKEAGKELSICVIEKAKEVGGHALSGAVMNPAAIRELFPNWLEDGFPVESPVEEDHVYFMTENDVVSLPVIPPPMNNHGNYVVTLGRVVRWLCEKAESAGVDVFPGFPAVDLLQKEGRVIGVRTGDKGLDKNGEKKPNFEEGVDIHAKVTILGEGPRGTLSRMAINRFQLQKGKNPAVFAIGIKEIWEMPEGHVHEGRVIHTMGYPLKNDAFGGGFIYSMGGNRINIGWVVGLDYKDPFLDPHYEFQRFKSHPKIRQILEGGKMVEYGAKTIPEGGWFSVPKLHMPGCMLVGDSAGLLDAMKLKGVHLAMKSGMLAAETAFAAIEKDDFSDESLSPYQAKVEASFIKKELWKSRYFKHGFKLGFLGGLVNGAIGTFTNGWSPFSRLKIEPGHREMQTIEQYHGRGAKEPERMKFDDKLTFGKLTNVYNSGTIHEEDSPNHLLVADTNICVDRCTEEYGNPCQRFCPASVYEWVKTEENPRGKLQINFTNCVHCKTCDIMDPYGVIQWVPPEGGGGPAWQNL